MKKGIIFDLDGTLWDASKEVADSWMLAMADYPQMEKPITREAIQSVMGKIMPEIGDILFAGEPEEKRKELLNECLKVENEYLRRHGGNLFDGLEETLGVLQQKYHLYIVSNCQVGYIEAFLEYHRLGKYFDDYESFGGTGKPKGENIRLVYERNHLDAAVYVGDTQGDYDAACLAGVPFIHTRTGYGTVNADVPYVEKIAQLPEMAGRILQ